MTLLILVLKCRHWTQCCHWTHCHPLRHFPLAGLGLQHDLNLFLDFSIPLGGFYQRQLANHELLQSGIDPHLLDMPRTLLQWADDLLPTEVDRGIHILDTFLLLSDVHQNDQVQVQIPASSSLLEV